MTNMHTPVTRNRWYFFKSFWQRSHTRNFKIPSLREGILKLRGNTSTNCGLFGFIIVKNTKFCKSSINLLKFDAKCGIIIKLC